MTDLFRTCRKKPCAGAMDETLRAVLERTLPSDAAQRCHGRLYAGVTVLGDGSMPKSVMASVLDGLNNRADMIATIAASAYIPVWSGRRCAGGLSLFRLRPDPRTTTAGKAALGGRRTKPTPAPHPNHPPKRSLFTTWRGMETADGSISTDQPCPPGVSYCLRIASRSPEMARTSLSDIVTSIFRALQGATPAAARVRKPRLPDAAPALSAGKAAALKGAGLDIAPGLSVSNVFDGTTWTELGLIPCDPETCDYLYRMGQLDTMAWAEATGIAAAAKRRKEREAAASAAAAAAAKAAAAAAKAAAAAEAAAAKTAATAAAAAAKTAAVAATAAAKGAAAAATAAAKDAVAAATAAAKGAAAGATAAAKGAAAGAAAAAKGTAAAAAAALEKGVHANKTPGAAMFTKTGSGLHVVEQGK